MALIFACFVFFFLFLYLAAVLLRRWWQQRQAKQAKKLAKAERIAKMNDAGVNDKDGLPAADGDDDDSVSGSESDQPKTARPVTAKVAAKPGSPSVPVRPKTGAKEAWNADDHKDSGDEKASSDADDASRPGTAGAAGASPVGSPEFTPRSPPKPKVTDAAIAKMQHVNRKGVLPPLAS